MLVLVQTFLSNHFKPCPLLEEILVTKKVVTAYKYKGAHCKIVSIFFSK